MADDYEPLDRPIEEVMVRGAFTNVASFHFDDGDAHMLEMRVYTVDGEEHHLIWPLQVALPLLQPILNVSLANMEGMEVHTPVDTPDHVDDIDWGDER